MCTMMLLLLVVSWTIGGCCGWITTWRGTLWCPSLLLLLLLQRVLGMMMMSIATHDLHVSGGGINAGGHVIQKVLMELRCSSFNTDADKNGGHREEPSLHPRDGRRRRRRTTNDAAKTKQWSWGCQRELIGGSRRPSTTTNYYWLPRNAEPLQSSGGSRVKLLQLRPITANLRRNWYAFRMTAMVAKKSMGPRQAFSTHGQGSRMGREDG